MRYSTQIKPISYLKANAADVLDKLQENRQPLIITQNGEAKAVMLDLATYENTQETLALLKILALGNQQIEQGQFSPAAEVFARVRASRAARTANDSSNLGQKAIGVGKKRALVTKLKRR
jgi:prevent-host-death family protein